ncbi:MAG: hypothetical protein BKP49_08415 [Treponema sp. CETP13]|nr:MAG: hypothetical protein BKP49_08415 [Treponema sp. CETP13]
MSKISSRYFIVALMCVMIHISLFSQSNMSKDESNDEWILAASSFTVDQEEVADAETPVSLALTEIKDLLPKLILSNINLPAIRKVKPEELLSREKLDLESSYISLVSTYESKLETKDTLIITAKEDDDFKDQLEEAEEAVLEAKKELEETDLKRKELNVQDFTETSENIVLYKDDSSVLFTMPKTGEPNTIQGLITGSIQLVGEYCHAKIQLVLYPGSKILYDETFTFRVNEIKSNAAQITRKLLPVIQNEDVVSILFQLAPKEVSDAIEIRVDGELVELDSNNAIVVSRNWHKISFNCDGYATAQTLANFSEEDSYTVQINLRKLKINEIKIDSSIPLKSLFVNGLEFNPEEPFLVDFLPAMGQAVISPNAATYFIITDDGNQFLKPNTQDISDYIEKRRRLMYTSYGALLLSFPFSFITYGMYIDANYSAYSYGINNGYDDTYTNLVEKQDNLEKVSNVTMAISIGLGVNLAYQFVRYILAVNKVLPKKTKTIKSASTEE